MPQLLPACRLLQSWWQQGHALRLLPGRVLSLLSLPLLLAMMIVTTSETNSEV